MSPSSKAETFRQHAGGTDLRDADQSVYGTRGDGPPPLERSLTPRQIEIVRIYRNPIQPRRIVPSAVQAAWDGQTGTIQAMLETWITMAIEERPGFQWMPYLRNEEAERAETPGPIEASLVELLDLAADIHRTGLLIQPINVVNQGENTFLIESGERRWLAFHLLNAMFGAEGKWRTIPAYVSLAFDPWRQASENGARSNLNAIAKARQLALLLMAEHSNHHFRSFDEMVKPGTCDRAFYAQVADGIEFRIGRGRADAYLQALGLKNPVQLRQYRALLSASDEVWQMADDLGWSDKTIQLHMKPKPQNNGNDTVRKVTVSAVREWAEEFLKGNPDGDQRRSAAQELRKLADELEGK